VSGVDFIAPYSTTTAPRIKYKRCAGLSNAAGVLEVRTDVLDLLQLWKGKPIAR
jgi:hypothetical protein